MSESERHLRAVGVDGWRIAFLSRDDSVCRNMESNMGYYRRNRDSINAYLPALLG